MRSLRIDALLLRGLLHLLPVLVDASQEEHVALEARLMARKKVREHLLVRVPEMRRAVDVVNRGGEKIGTGHMVNLTVVARVATVFVVAAALRAAGG